MSSKSLNEAEASPRSSDAPGRPSLRRRLAWHGQAASRAQWLDMTAQLNDAFEAWIRERPDQWYCGKRRWTRRSQLEAMRNAG